MAFQTCTGRRRSERRRHLTLARRRRLLAGGGALALALTIAVPVGIFTADDAEAYRAPQSATLATGTNTAAARQMFDTNTTADADVGQVTYERTAGEQRATGSTASGGNNPVMQITYGSTDSGRLDVNGNRNFNMVSIPANFDQQLASTQFSPNVGTTIPSIEYKANRDGNITASTASGESRSAEMLIRYNYAVSNPNIHFAGTGGVGGTGGVLGIGATYYTVTPVHQINAVNNPGVTWTVPSGTTTNLTTDTNGTRLVPNDSVAQMNDARCTGTQWISSQGGSGAAYAGCGTGVANGTFTTLALNVTLQKSTTNSGNVVNYDPVNEVYTITQTFKEDQGDAPASYETFAGGTYAATHTHGGVILGTTIDDDSTTTANPTTSPYSVAAAANNNGVLGDGTDEDAFPASGPPSFPAAAGAYAVTVPISNTVDPGDICGWIDFNNNGTFDGTTGASRTYTGTTSPEMSCTTFQKGQTSVTLNWPYKPATTPGTNLYMRLRAVGSYYDYASTNDGNYTEILASLSGISGTSNFFRDAYPQFQVGLITDGNTGVSPIARTGGLASYAPNCALTNTCTVGAGLITRPLASSSPIAPLDAPLSGTFNAAGPAYTGEVEDYQVLSQPVNDYGDAPATYGTAQHTNYTATLRIGRNEDSETAANTSADARGDDTNPVGGTDDEDGLSSNTSTTPDANMTDAPTALAATATSYTQRVWVTNTTGSAATLAGWIDINRNGTFDSTERATVSVPTNVAYGYIDLTWTIPAGTAVPGASFMRLRLIPGTITAPDPATVITGGEAEDYAITITGTPGLTLQKTGLLTTDKDGDGKADAGDVITYSFKLTNSGTLPLSSLSVTDSKIATASISCPVTSLAPGAVTTCTGTYAVTQADVDNTSGQVTNTATARGVPQGSTTPFVSAASTSSTPTDRTRAISMTKTVADSTTPAVPPATSPTNTPDGRAALGERLTYTFTVTNTGTITLSNIRITDSKLQSGSITCVQPTGGLAPGAKTTCTATYTTVAADMNLATLTNTATATGTGPGGTDVTSPSSSASIPTYRTTGIRVAKSQTLLEASSDPALIGDGYAEAGDQIRYFVVVYNTGTTQLTNISVSDPMLAAANPPVTVTCPTTTLLPGMNTQCGPFLYTVTEQDVAAGRVVNTATATGTPPTGLTAPTATPSTVTQPTNPHPTVSITKTGTLLDQDGDTRGDVGEIIYYEYTVTNTGNMTLSSVYVSDSKITDGSVSCQATTLAPDASTTCTAFYTISQADVDYGSVTNTATATGTPPDPDPNDNVPPTPVSSQQVSYTVSPMDSTSSISLVKHSTLVNTNGSTRAALNPSGTEYQEDTAGVGEIINFTFEVTNTGTTVMNSIAVNDPILAGQNPPVAIVCPAAQLPLAPGATITCYGNGSLVNPADPTPTPGDYVTTQADVDSGRVTNSAVATGTTASGTQVGSNTSTATTPTEGSRALSLTKTGTLADTNGDGLRNLGDTITYSFTVTNPGTGSTVNSIVIKDTQITGGVTCGATSLAAGASTTCSATYTVTQADVDAGRVDNIAIANGTDAQTGATVASNEAVHNELLTANPSITLDKQAVLENTNGSSTMLNGVMVSSADAGENITYRFVVTNTGNQTLSNVTVADAMFPPDDSTTPPTPAISCPSGYLRPGDSVTCSANYIVSTEDVLAGVITNTASAQATAPPYDDDGPTGPDPAAPGPAVNSNTDTTTTPTNQVASLGLDKQATLVDGNGNALAEVGETITYTFTVTNTGTVPLENVAVTDPKAGTITCPETALLPGEDTLCTAGAYTVTQADVDTGAVRNTATATGSTTLNIAQPAPARDTTTTPTNYTPALTLDKTGQLTTDTGIIGQARAGDVVTYTFALANTGTVTLTSPQVSDSKVGTVTCPSGPVAVGATVYCTATYTVTQADVGAQEVRNTATASALSPDITPDDGVAPGPVISDPDTNVVPVEYVRSMRLAKTANVQTARLGDTVTYTFTITNTGTTILQHVTITDPKIAATAGSVTCNEPTGGLLPNAQMTCTANYTVTQTDADAGQVANTATATAETPNPNDSPVRSSASTSVITVPTTPSLSLDKTHGPGDDADGDGYAEVGESIIYTFTLTNTGDVTLTNLKVTDWRLVAAGDTVTCPTTPLAPGQSAVCRAVYDVTQADVNSGSVANTATASAVPATPASGVTPPAIQSNQDDTVVPTLVEPSATMDKRFSLQDKDGDARADVGEYIYYGFYVLNTGTVTLNTVTVVDDLRGDGVTDTPVMRATCVPSTGLAPGATAICTAQRLVTQADVDAAQAAMIDTDKDGTPDTSLPSIINTAYATALPPSGTAITTNTDTVATPIDNTSTASLVKSAQLLDGTGDTPPGNGDGQADVGERVAYTFTVTNTGKLTLTTPVVRDQMLADQNVLITCPQDDPVTPAIENAVPPGGTVTCTASYRVTQADVNHRRIHNEATVSLTDSLGGTVTTPMSAATLTPGFHPSITMTKDGVLTNSNTVVGSSTTTEDPPLADAGEAITYTFTVTNTGNVTLSPVTVSDPRLAAAGVTVTCPADDPATTDVDEGALLPGATTTCISGPYTVTQADVDAGPVANTATATGIPPSDPATPDLPPTPVMGTASDTVPVDNTPALTLVKTASFVGTANDLDGDGLADVGENIVFEFAVTNSGGVTEKNLRVSDPMLAAAGVAVTCPVSVLAPGATTTCTATYPVTQADADRGQITNVAIAVGSPPDPNYDPPPYDPDGPTGPQGPVDPGPGQDPDGDGPAQPGEVPSNPSDTLTPADTTADLQIAKTAALTTDPDGDKLGDPGDVITYIVTTANAGAVTLTNVLATDSMLAAAGITLTCQPGTKTPADPAGSTAPCTTLVPGQSVQWTATYTVTQADVNKGQVVNSATGQAGSPSAQTVLADPDGAAGPLTPGTPVSTTTPTDSTPRLALVKTATLDDDQTRGKGFANGGETIKYTFTVTNTGRVPLTDVSISDTLLDAGGDPITCPRTVLYPVDDPDTTYDDTQMTCTATRVVTNQDLLDYADAGLIRNVATANGTAPDGTAVASPQDDAEIPIANKSGGSIVKNGVLTYDADGDGLADAGDQISYTFTVTNTGEVPVTDGYVTDDRLAAAQIPIYCPSTSTNTVNPDPLLPYSTEPGWVPGTNVLTCKAASPYIVTQADVDAGQVLNTATATGTHVVDGVPTTATTGPSQDTTPTDTAATIAVAKTATLTETNGVTTDNKAEVGDTISYSFVVTNTGATTLTDVWVNDPTLTERGVMVPCDTLPPEGLEPGKTVSCASTTPYVVTPADVDSGVVHNSATAEGTPPDLTSDDGVPPTPIVSQPAVADVPTNLDPAMSLDKAAALTTDGGATGLADVGDVITFTFTLANEGTTTLTDLAVSDPFLAAAGIAPACQGSTKTPADPAGSTLPCNHLTLGQSVQFTANYTVTQADVNAGSVHNVATASAKGPDPDGPGTQQPPGVTADPDETTTPADVQATLTLAKTVVDTGTMDDPRTTTVNEASTTPDGHAELGETLRYSFEVTNTGTVTLTGIRVDDPMLAAAGVTVTCPAVALAPSATVTCTATAYTTTAADVAAGSVRNTATAYGTPPAGAEVASLIDDATIPTLAHPGMALQKRGDLVDASKVTPIPTPSPTDDPVTPPVTYDIADKDGDGKADIGDVVTYFFTVQNTGDVPLTAIVIDDPTLTNGPGDTPPGAGLEITCPALPDGGLAVGASITCVSEARLVTAADVETGEPLVNTASATAKAPDASTVGPKDSTATVPVDINPGIDLTKTAAVNSTDGTTDTLDHDGDGDTTEPTANVGETVTYTFLVTNTGDVPLTGVAVSDPLLTAATGVTGPTCDAATTTAPTPPGASTNGCDTLEPRQSVTFTATYPVTQDDVNKGTISNTATATGQPPSSEPPVTSNARSVVVPADLDPSVTVDKQAQVNGTQSTATTTIVAGDTVTFLFHITNTGTVPIVDISITDDFLTKVGATITCPDASPQTASATGLWTLTTPLAPPSTLGGDDGGTTTCTGTYIVQQPDVDAGGITNTATAKGRSPDTDGPGGNPPPSSPESPPSTITITADSTSSLTLDKTATLSELGSSVVNELTQAGDRIAYTFLVTNTGSTTLTGVAVDDPLLTARGITVTCTADDPRTADVVEIAVAPQGQAVCTASGPYTVTPQDVVNGVVPNTATASAYPLGNPTQVSSAPDTASVPTDVNPLIEMSKVASLGNTNGTTGAVDGSDLDGDGNTTELIGLADVGEQITYTFTVRNTGTTVLENLVIDDAMLSGLNTTNTCPRTTLDPGNSTTCAAVYTVTQDDVDAGQVVNTATATADVPVPQDPDGDGPLQAATPHDPVTSAEDHTTVPANVAPAVSLVKTSSLTLDNDADGLGDAGDQLTYAFTLRNTGTTTLTNPAVTDPKLAGANPAITVTCPSDPVPPDDPATLGIEGIITCTASSPYTITQADADSGSVYNEATPSATVPDGTTVTGAKSATNDPVDRTPALTLTKTAALDNTNPANTGPDTLDSNGDGSTTDLVPLADVGETIVFTFAVENTGSVTMSAITIADAMLSGATPPVAVTCPADDPGTPDVDEGLLAPGETVTCTSAAYTVTQADVDAGYVHNYAVALGTPPTAVDPDGLTNPADPTGPGSLRAPLPYDPPAYDPDGPGPQGLIDPAPGNPVPSNPGETTTPTNLTSSMEITKAASLANTSPENYDPDTGAALADIGETITFTFTVKNTGATTLTGVRVDDALLAGVNVTPTCQATTKTPADPGGSTLPCTTLQPGQSVTFTATYTVSGSDVAQGSVSNVASAQGTPPPVDPDGPGPLPPTPATPVVPEDPSDTSTPTYSPSEFILVKSATLSEEITPDGLAELGESITYTFTLTNTGATPLSNVRVDDPMLAAVGVAISCPVDNPGTTAVDESVLPVDGTMTCTSSRYSVTQQDVDSGRVYNAASATAMPSTGPDVTTPPDYTDTPTLRSARLTIDKTAVLSEQFGNTGDGKAYEGDTIAYTFLVTNSGNTTLENVTVDDAMFPGGTAIACQEATKTPPDSSLIPVPATPYCTTLAPGQSVQFTATYLVTSHDVNSGQVDNTATAQGTVPPAADPGPYDPDGTDGPIEPLTPPAAPLYDPDGPDGPLAPGAPVTSAPDSTSTPTELAPGLTLTKSAVPTSNPAGLGDTITYTLTVTNSGNVDLTGVHVNDLMFATTANPTGRVDCTPATLAPGAEATCAVPPHTVTQADVDAGQVHNTATATGTGPATSGDVTSGPAETTTPTVFTPALTIDKTATLTEVSPDPDGAGPLPATSDGLAAAGDRIVYTFTVTNTGTTTLTGVTIKDQLLDGLGLRITCDVTTLAPNAVATCTSWPYTVTAADVESGYVHNTATALGTSPTPADPAAYTGPAPVESAPDDTVTPTDARASLTLTKSAALAEHSTPTGDGLALAGDEIVFTYTIANTGTQHLDDIKVVDPMLDAMDPPVAVTCPSATLAVGETMRCTSDPYPVQQGDVDNGRVYNIATATGTHPQFDPDGPTGPLDPVPAGTVTAPPSATMTPADRRPAWTASKTAALADSAGAPKTGKAAVGDQITYTVTVTNTGTTTMDGVTVSDPMLAAQDPPITMTCTPSSLTPAQSASCTASRVYVVTQDDVTGGQVFNLATASGQVPPPVVPEPYDPDGPDGPLPPVTPPAPTVYDPPPLDPDGPGGQPPLDPKPGDPIASPPTGAVVPTDSTPHLTLAKTAALTDGAGGAAGSADVGETITYTFTVTNDGMVPLTGARVADPMLADAGTTATCVPGTKTPADAAPCTTLAPSQSVQFTATYTVTQDDVDAGQIHNQAIAVATTPTPLDPPRYDPDGPGGLPLVDPPALAWDPDGAGPILPGGDPDGDGPAGPGEVSSTPDDETVLTNLDPRLALTKTATLNDTDGDVDSYDVDTDQNTTEPLADAGERIAYTFVVRNAGTTTITDVRVDDAMLAGLTPPVVPVCQASTLAPGAQTTCTASYTVRDYDVARGFVYNTATATGTAPAHDGTGQPVQSAPAAAMVPADPMPHFSMVKSGTLVKGPGNTSERAEVGDGVTYAFTVTNDGSKALKDIAIDDPLLTGAGVTITCPPVTEASPLLAGRSMTCTSGTYAVTAADAQRGYVANTATPSAVIPNDPDGPDGPLPPYDPANPGPYDPDGPAGPLPPIDPTDPDGPGPMEPGDPVPGDPAGTNTPIPPGGPTPTPTPTPTEPTPTPTPTPTEPTPTPTPTEPAPGPSPSPTSTRTPSPTPAPTLSRPPLAVYAPPRAPMPRTGAVVGGTLAAAAALMAFGVLGLGARRVAERSPGVHNGRRHAQVEGQAGRKD